MNRIFDIFKCRRVIFVDSYFVHGNNILKITEYAVAFKCFLCHSALCRRCNNHFHAVILERLQKILYAVLDRSDVRIIEPQNLLQTVEHLIKAHVEVVFLYHVAYSGFVPLLAKKVEFPRNNAPHHEESTRRSIPYVHGIEQSAVHVKNCVINVFHSFIPVL